MTEMRIYNRICADVYETRGEKVLEFGLTAKQAYQQAWNFCLKATGKGGRK